MRELPYCPRCGEPACFCPEGRPPSIQWNGMFDDCDSDGTATAAINEDLSVPKDCQARAESIAQMKPPKGNHP